MGDWLGTGSRRRNCGSFELKTPALCAHSLKLKSEERMARLCQIREEARRHSSQSSMRHTPSLAGTESVTGLARVLAAALGGGFSEARAFVHSLKLKSRTEWDAYTKSGKKPTDIPADPNTHTPRLAGPEWATGSARAQSRPASRVSTFKEARAFVNSLDLKWKPNGALTLNRKPTDIPTNRARTLSNWLGQDWRCRNAECDPPTRVSTVPMKPVLRDSLGLKSQIEWNAFYKTDEEARRHPR